MSFGFGFALPAYPLRGGGGNNPFNQLGPTLDLSFVDGATNVGNQLGADTYTLDTNFITPQYQVAAQYAVWVDGSGMTQRNFADIVTFTRGSAATQFDSTGTLIFAPMNAIRNNMMVGAVAGTPGTLPTNWLAIIYGTGGSLATSVVGTGVENGITYVDVRINGTAGTGSRVQWYWDTATGIPAQTGQTWTLSHYAKLVGGSWTNVTTYGLRLDEFTSVGGYITGADNSAAVFPGTGALNTQRTSFTTTLNGGATTANTQPSNIIYFANGTAVDFTLRIGMPQLERGSTATAVNATSGTAYYGPRFDFNPSTLAAQGLLIEEQRTNSIRNNTMQGAVAGTPGTLPTNWGVSGLGTLTQQVVGTGTVNGITYIDLRFSGTTSTTQLGIRFEPSAIIAAANGQTWTGSTWCAVTAGSTTNITGNGYNANIYDSGSVFLASILLGAVNTTSTLTRTTHSGTIVSATAAFIQPQIYLTFNSGVAIDITLRIGLPQLEQGAFATSVIPTTTTALTRNADQASVNTLSPWYNQTEGTVYAEARYPFAAASGLNSGFVELDDGTFSEASAIYVTSGGNATWAVRDGGVTQATVTVSGMTANTVIKIAGAYALNDFQQATNGTLGTADTSGTLPTVNRLALGDIAVGQKLNGWLRRVSYFPRRLPNADLVTITA